MRRSCPRDGLGGMMRYRWLDDSRPVRYLPAKRYGLSRRGQLARIFQLPAPGAIGNVGIEFEDGHRTVTSAGCLRQEKGS